MNTTPDKVVLYPSSVLTKKAREITMDEIDSGDIAILAQNMRELMTRANGVGIAAPQIGEAIRMTVIDAADGSGFHVLVNPKIISSSKLTTVAEEGCLSLPGIYGAVKRKRKVTVEYLDEHGNKKTLKAHPFLSRVIQHELDHLDGILFTSKLERPLDNDAQARLDEWEQGKKPLISVPYPYTYL
ncbi:MAG: peptide deformylase [Patescibacteria group bacterium]